MKRIALVLFAVALAAAAFLVSAQASTPKLTGTVGPGYTITLKKGTTKVKTLKAGKYTFVITDKASIHNFTVKGPGISNRTITGTAFVGTKTALLTLKPGKYTLYCTVHPTMVRTTLTVR